MEKNSHLVLVTSDFKPNLGGIAEYLHCLWNQLSLYNLTTVISTVSSRNQKWSYNYDLKILTASTIKNRANSQFQTWNLLRDFHPDRVITPSIESLNRDNVRVFIGVWNPLTHFWCKGLRKAGIEYSLFVYGKELLDRHFDSFAVKRAEDISYARKIYGCSDATCRLARSICGKAIDTQTIYPGIKTISPRHLISEEIKSYRQKLNISSSNTIILSLSRLVDRKGVDIALQAIASLIPQHPNLTYIVAGEGEAKPKLQQMTRDWQIDDRVLFLGAVDNLTKTILLHLCDIFVLPIRQSITDDWEGFGITFLEAAVAGKPSIAGKTGGVVEAVADKVSGFLVDTDDFEQTKDKIELLISNPDLRKKMGDNAKQYAGQFTWKKSASRLRIT